MRRNQRTAMFLLKPSRFVAGGTINDAFKVANTFYKHKGWLSIVDHAKEGARSPAEAIANKTTLVSDISQLQMYMHMNGSVMPYGFALKMSSFCHDPASKKTIDTTLALMTQVIKKLLFPSVKIYKLPHMPCIFLDAELCKAHAYENVVYNKLIKHFDTPLIYKTYQMYRKDSFEKMLVDMETFPNMSIKLVRGAYMSPDKAYVKSGVLWNTKEKTDEAYNRAMYHLINEQLNKKTQRRVLVATHNAETIDKAINQLQNKTAMRVSFAQLMGMRDDLSLKLQDDLPGQEVWKYVPYGHFLDTWPYLVRRFAENAPHMSKHLFF